MAAVAPKITGANCEVILEHVSGNTKREARCFLSKVDYQGNINREEGRVEISLTLSESELKKLEEARSVLSAGGKIPTNSEVILRALDDLLDRRDPVRRAERAESRAKKKAEEASFRNEDLTPNEDSSSNEGIGTAFTVASDRNDVNVSFRNDAPKGSKFSRRNEIPRTGVPKAVSHQVWLRDGRQCSHVFPDGRRCDETLMLELDHIVAWGRGGRHTVANLQVVCRRHNQNYGDLLFGKAFMDRFRGATAKRTVVFDRVEPAKPASAEATPW